MSKYQIVSAPTNDGLFGINPDWLIKDSETGKYFNGYDFMGSVEWVNIGEAYCMSKDEAQDIVNDLEAADEPMAKDEPEHDLPGKMMAIMSSVRADDPSCEYHEFDRKTMTEYTSWLLRAAARGYEISREEPDHQVVYLSSQTHKNVSFQIAFRQC